MIADHVLARLKRGCRDAIALAGNISGAVATTGKAQSTVGNWHNRQMADTPVLADAFLLDEVAVMAGKRPPILCALAGELGCAVIVLPEGEAAEGETGLRVLQLVAETGDVADRLRLALADGKGLDRAEIEALLRETDEVIDNGVQLRAHLRALLGVDVVEIRQRGEG